MNKLNWNCHQNYAKEERGEIIFWNTITFWKAMTAVCKVKSCYNEIKSPALPLSKQPFVESLTFKIDCPYWIFRWMLMIFRSLLTLNYLINKYSSLRVQAFLDFHGFDFRDFWFTLFSTPLVLISNLHLRGFCFCGFPHIKSRNACNER